jgi:branched-chain amino acid transport system substrate-binding protein
MSNETDERRLIEEVLGRHIDRRDFLRLTGYAGATAGLGAFLAACSPSASGTPTAPPATAGPTATSGATQLPTGRAIKIGYVSPTTGPLAGFGEADAYIIAGANKAFAGGVNVAGTLHPVQILAKDSQSNPDTAASVAGTLILQDGIDLMLVASTPETTNPVAGQCEANQVPCISTVAPWQPYFIGRQNDPTKPDTWKPFDWTYHFFWGLEDIIAVFLDMWGQVPTNKQVAGLFPNDGDGNAWGDKTLGFPPPLAAAGYTMHDPGRYEDLSSDFTAQISAFKTAGATIMTGVPIPPDFTTFWNQAKQQGFKPKIASIGKALLFPSSVEALGTNGEGDGLSSELWWSPNHPFKSSLTGETAKALADGYTTATTKQWTQPLGFAHALFEVASDVLKRTTDIESKATIRDALKVTVLDTVVGKVDWTVGKPYPNISKTPLVGGQWGKGTTFPYDLVCVSNKDHPEIPAGGKMRPIGG